MKIAFMSVIALLIAIGCMFETALAHDSEHPEHNDWLRSLHAQGGAWCCTGDDVKTDVDWESKDGHYRVHVDGEWWDVPDEAIVQGPNKMGRTLVWMNGGYAGHVGPRCFMPGAGI